MKKKFQWNTLVSRRETILWVVVFVAVTFIGIKQLILPPNPQIAGLKEQVDVKDLELSVLEKFASAQKEKTQMPNIYRQIVQDKVEKFFKGSNLTPDVLVSDLMGFLTRPSFAKLALVEGFQFVSQEHKAGYVEMKFKLSLIGEYRAVTQFIRKFKKLPYLISFQDIQLAAFGSPKEATVKLVSTVMIYVADSKKQIPVKASSVDGSSDKATDILLDLNSPGKQAPFATTPRGTSEWSIYELELNGTISGTGRSTALINGKIFEVGDVVGGYRIVDILPRSVVLKRRGAEFILRMSEDLTGDSQVDPEGGQRSSKGNVDPVEKKDEEPSKEEAPTTQPKEADEKSFDEEAPKAEDKKDAIESEEDFGDEETDRPLEGKVPSSQQAW